MRNSRRTPKRKSLPPSPPITVTAGALGARGDVVAEHQGQRLYIPFALPGETLHVRPGASRGEGRSADLLAVVTSSPDRVEPPCPHFGTCGGCTLQHMAPMAEAAWKRELVKTALARRGFENAPVAPTVSLPPGARRRATLTYRRIKGGVILGFNERQSHQIVDVAACPVLCPELSALLPLLRTALPTVLSTGATGDLLMQWTGSGADLRLDLPASPNLEGRERLAGLADALDLARLTVRIDGFDEPVAERRAPLVTLGGVAGSLPPGAFLQPSQAGEDVLRTLVLEAVADVDGPVADLFCGLGTFALPLAARHAVTAIDSDGPAIGALTATAKVRTFARDLFSDPLQGRELASFSAVVFDPPRAGAREQSEALAAAGPAVVVAVSCSPASFARDARVLVDGGYDLERVTLVDQFAWSAHVEVVAVFRRRCS